MIGEYLNQTATWHRVTSRDGYGEPTHESKTIPVRWEGKRQLVRDKEGQEVISESRVFCTAPVQAGDLLEYAGRKWPVITVATIPGLEGATGHREVAL